eukprot:jgi/Mesen1/10631/ME000894S10208
MADIGAAGHPEVAQQKSYYGHGPMGSTAMYGASPAYKPFGTFARNGGMSAYAGHQEVRSASLWRSVLAEFFATLALVYIGLAAIVWGANAANYPIGFVYSHPNFPLASRGVQSIGYLGVAFAFGFAYFCTVFFTQHISGGYQNPAVTFALMLVGRLAFLRGILYMIAQLAGAVVGAGLVKGVHGRVFNAAIGGSCINNPPFSKGGAFFVEVVATAILVFFILSSTDIGYTTMFLGKHIQMLGPLLAGLIYFSLILITIPVTGGCVNPVRAFGSAAIYNADFVWHDHWIFWFGPLVGLLIGALLYEVLFRRSYTPLDHSTSDVAPAAGAPGYGAGAPGAGYGAGAPGAGVPAAGYGAGQPMATGPHAV